MPWRSQLKHWKTILKHLCWGSHLKIFFLRLFTNLTAWDGPFYVHQDCQPTYRTTWYETALEYYLPHSHWSRRSYQCYSCRTWRGTFHWHAPFHANSAFCSRLGRNRRRWAVKTCLRLTIPSSDLVSLRPSLLRQLSLELAFEALENPKIPISKINCSDMGVFVANAIDDG